MINQFPFTCPQIKVDEEEERLYFTRLYSNVTASSLISKVQSEVSPRAETACHPSPSGAETSLSLPNDAPAF